MRCFGLAYRPSASFKSIGLKCRHCKSARHGLSSDNVAVVA